MAQHFSRSKRYRDLQSWDTDNMTEEQAWEKFVMARWGSLSIMPCPRCGTVDKHYRRATRHQWCCKHCDHVFSVTSGTPFQGRRLPFRKLLKLIRLLCNAPKGLAANAILGELGVAYRTAYQNLGKIREAIFLTQNLNPLHGVVQIDGGHFCGKPRRPQFRNKMTAAMANHYLRNRKASIVPPQAGIKLEPWNKEKLKNRRIVLVLRQIKPAERIITVIVSAETRQHVLPVIQKYVATNSTIQTDDGGAYSSLSAWYEHEVVRHSETYCTPDGIHNNYAESFFSRMRRSEYGVHHGMRPQYLAFYAATMAWIEVQRESALREKMEDLCQRILSCDISLAFRGYCQGRHLGFEYLG
ncbi:IS1595 family transposase [Chromobacterium phragmitis]|uniref:IS1595 family transposase n=1 Tax=Chromobacterium amazonense TaxID=1382803 RepID=UPI0021B7019C|nr:IS1595 family transposase [Chromobacterium amazonense]MBM2885521.1 IS1595 family transposase [Chromobacterium amazonense]MDE1716476.1 IS1595 family transposase [Chromobacterium amazonense]